MIDNIKQFYRPQNLKLWIFLTMIFLTSCANSDTNIYPQDVDEITTENDVLSSSEFEQIINDMQENHYTVMQFKNQLWTTSNHQQTIFNNGDPIKEAKNDNEWFLATQNKEPVWCYYNYDAANKELYGVYYNWFAVNDTRGITPEGWSVTSNQQAHILARELNFDAHHLKEENLWKEKRFIFNSTGFSARPGGLIRIDGTFADVGDKAFFWTSTEKNEINAMYFDITDAFNSIHFSDLPKQLGLPIRLYKPINID